MKQRSALKQAAEIVREYGPFPGVEKIGGVTYDGHQIWIASGDKLNAIDPEAGKLVRSLDVAAHAGTALDDDAVGAVIHDIPVTPGFAAG